MSIRADDAAYRRGVVFGFTVAEVVLLLVFCLLLLFVPLVLKDLQDRSAAGERATPSLSIRGGGFLGDSSASPQGASAKPLPDGWIRVSPDAADSSANPTNGRAETPPASSANPAAPQEAKRGELDLQALTLKGACERMGIPLANCTVTVANQKLESLGRHNWPPMIKLREADGEFFFSGKAEVSPAFDKKIRDTIPTILERAREFQTDVIEVVGHTDEQGIVGVLSNLDTTALAVLVKGEPATSMRPGDNAGLGFARAIAIVQVLKSDKRLSDRFTILPLSSAQVANKDGKISDGSDSGDVKERRRIEIRLRKSDP